MKFKSLRGMDDLFSIDLAKWQTLETAFKSVFLKFNAGEVRNPILESTDLFARSVGSSSDIVNKELYTFNDRNDESISLRPEGTAGLVRSLIESKKDNDTGKYWYQGPMFRYERPQKGRLRQFHQVGVEYVGFEEGHAEFEIMSLVIALINSVKIKHYNIKINHLGNSKVKQKFTNALVEFLQKFEGELSDLELTRLGTNPLRILDSKDPKTLKILEKSPSYTDYLEPDHLSILNNLLDDFGESNITIDPKLVRGLDYYTGFIFEVTSKELGSQDSFIGGGRYDSLFSSLGGKDIPAIGFAIGLERMIDIMPESAKANKKVFIVNLTSNKSRYPYKIAQNLRSLDTNIVVEDPLLTSSAKSQLRRANKAGASAALIIGDDEVSKNEVIWKDLDNKIEQQSLSLDELINKFKKL